jgi:acyl carrier protein
MNKDIDTDLREYLSAAKRDLEDLALDSLSLTALIVHIQTEYGVQIRLEDVLEGSNFSSLAAIKALIERRRKNA